MNPIGDFLKWSVEDAYRFQESGALPDRWEEAVTVAIEMFEDGSLWCGTCGGVGCLHFVFREWDAVDDCPGHCCPDCRPVKEKQ